MNETPTDGSGPNDPGRSRRGDPEFVDSIDDDEIDTGEPVDQLRDLALTVSPEFCVRVRGTIGRRVLWSDLATFTSEAFGYTALEHLSMLFHYLQPPNPRGEAGRSPGATRNGVSGRIAGEETEGGGDDIGGRGKE